MTQQPNERAATSLRLEGPGLGLGLDPDEIDAYLAAVNAGLIIAETRCDQGMQDNFALPAAPTTELAASCPPRQIPPAARPSGRDTGPLTGITPAQRDPHEGRNGQLQGALHRSEERRVGKEC